MGDVLSSFHHTLESLTVLPTVHAEPLQPVGEEELLSGCVYDQVSVVSLCQVLSDVNSAKSEPAYSLHCSIINNKGGVFLSLPLPEDVRALTLSL